MFRNISVGSRLGLGFGLVVLMLIGVTGWGIWGLDAVITVNHKILEDIRRDARIFEKAQRVKANTLGLRRFEKDFLLNIQDKKNSSESDRKKMSGYKESWNHERGQLETHLNNLEMAALTDKSRVMVKSMKEDLTAYVKGFNRVSEKVEAGVIKTPEEGNAAAVNFKDEGLRLETSASTYVEMAAGNETAILDIGTRTPGVIWVVVFVSMLVSMLIAWVITRGITGPVKMAAGIAERITQGDVTVAIEFNLR